MGHTNFWRFSKNPKDIKNGAEKFAKSVDILKRALKKTHCKLAGETGKGRPTFNENLVCFNGYHDEAVEPFYLPLDNENFEFSFCKTYEEPYDLAVCLTLLSFKKNFGKSFSYEVPYKECPSFIEAKRIMKSINK